VTAGSPADPFVRGCAWPGTDDMPYPRADPTDLDRLPGDTVATARLPVGVRLELVGDADVVELDYETMTDDLGYRGEGAGTAFTLLAGDESVSVPARLGPLDKVELELPGSAHHELLAYRVAPGSPVARGERIPRWARPSLVLRDGRSMRFQDMGRLAAGDQVYIFVPDRYPRLLDKLFASRAVVDPEDADFFGAFAVDPARSAAELIRPMAIFSAAVKWKRTKSWKITPILPRSSTRS